MLRGVLTLKVRLIVLGVTLLAGALVVVLVVVMAVFGSAQGASATSCVPTNEVPDAPSGAATEQVENARIIDRTAAKLGLSGAASRIAIIAAIGESSLVNLGYGDEGQGVTNPDGSSTDSKGLFQQQPSQGWGTIAQVMDPEYATTSFLIGKKHDRTGGLVAVPNWDSIEATVAIHKVQINADPNHYARYYSQADQIIKSAGIDVSRPGNDSAASTPVAGATGGTDTAAGCSTGGGESGSAGKAVQPLDGAYNETSGYGPRTSPAPGASSWHPAVDLVPTPACGAPIHAVLPGTVTVSDRLTLSVKSPEGFTVSYLHSHKSDRSVDVGQTVTAGQTISKVGNEAPSTGCHLDLRINVTGNTNPEVAALPVSPVVPGYVDPHAFMKLYGVDLCPAATCRKTY
jgi:murein DD-endopeptidase MepM/ murein hydrolase activator NlpD